MERTTEDGCKSERRRKGRRKKEVEVKTDRDEKVSKRKKLREKE